MKTNYNPYSVPEGFFEDSADKAVARYGRRRRTVFCTVAAMAAAAAIILVTPLFVKQADKEQETISTNLAQMYEYDIFLQVNF